MFDEIPALAPSRASTPTAEPSLGESALPAPTSERVEITDRIFAETEPRHPLAELFVVPAVVGLLRDVVADSFDASEEDAEKKKHKESNATGSRCRDGH